MRPITGSAFDRWLDRFLSEKGLDLDTSLGSVDGPSGPNWGMTVRTVVEAMKGAPAHEQARLKAALVRLDYHAAPILPFVRHLAGAIAR